MSPDGAQVAFRSGSAPPISSVIEKHQLLVDPERPVEMRLRVAKGLLPAAIADLVPTLCFLTHDPSPQVRRAAHETMATLPDDQLLPVIQKTNDVYVIDVISRVLRFDSKLVPELAVNKHTHNATLVHLAGSGNRQTCDVIGRNAARALLYTPIIEALFFNPRASQGTVQALIELAVREDIDLDHMPGFRETKAALMGERGARDDIIGAGLDEIEFLSALEYAFDDGTDLTEEQTQERRMNLQTALMNMSVAQKIRLALVGDSNARKLLIRDPKKLIALAVLKSPRMTGGEVRIFAGKKELGEEVIATICRHRAWTRDYNTRKALLFNPKTPQAAALAFLRSMRESDIKMLSKHRDVPGVVRRAAKNVMDKKAQARKKRRNK